MEHGSILTTKKPSSAGNLSQGMVFRFVHTGCLLLTYAIA